MSNKNKQETPAQESMTTPASAAELRALLMEFQSLTTATSKARSDEHPSIQALKASQAYIQASAGVKAAMVKDLKGSLMTDDELDKRDELRRQAAFKAGETRKQNAAVKDARINAILARAESLAQALTLQQ
jgi:hypothetical protein